MLSRGSKALSVASRAALLTLAGISLVVAGAIGTAATVTRVLDPGSTAEQAPHPDVRYSWRIDSGTPDQAASMTVRVGATLSDPASACANPSRCTLGWRLNGAPLRPGQAIPVTFDASGLSLLTYEGRAEPLGLYQSWAVVTGSPQIDIIMQRVPPDFGANGIVTGPIGPQTLSISWADLPAPMKIFNGTSASVTLTNAPMVHLFRDDGSSTYATFVAEIPVNCPSLTIPAGEPISCRLTIPGSAGPGRYRMTVSPAGGIARTSVPPVDFLLRLHWSYAWLILFVGGIGGAWLEAYQNSGRRRALQLADAQDLSDKAKTVLESADPVAQRDTCRVLQTIVDALEAAMPLLKASRTADVGPQLERVASRLPAIGLFADLEKEYDRQTRPGNVKPVYDAALTAVSADALPADAAQKLEDLRAKLEPGRSATLDASGGGDTIGLFSMILPQGSSIWLRNWVRRNDKIIAFMTIVLASTIGVVLLWTDNASWGSGRDILLALLTGASGTVAGTLSIKGLVSSYPLGTITLPR